MTRALRPEGYRGRPARWPFALALAVAGTACLAGHSWAQG